MLQPTSPRDLPSTFERWCSKHIRWKLEPSSVHQHLCSSNCIISVDGSFFPHRPEHISAVWFVTVNETIIGLGDFLSSASLDCRSTCAAELCGVLAALQHVDHCMSQTQNNAKLYVSIATDCQGVIDRLQKLASLVTMHATSHPIVREILHLKMTRCKSLDLIKVAAHQDDLKAVD